MHLSSYINYNSDAINRIIDYLLFLHKHVFTSIVYVIPWFVLFSNVMHYAHTWTEGAFRAAGTNTEQGDIQKGTFLDSKMAPTLL